MLPRRINRYEKTGSLPDDRDRIIYMLDLLLKDAHAGTLERNLAQLITEAKLSPTYVNYIIVG